MNEEQGNSTQAQGTKKARGFRLTWWLWAIIIIAVVAIIAVVIVRFTSGGASTTGSATTKPDTAEEIKIKQYMSSLRGDIVRFYEENKTYDGWKPNDNAISQVKTMGSELKTQALSKDTYIIYAKLPTSKTVFCMDHNNYTGEVSSLMAWAKACK